MNDRTLHGHASSNLSAESLFSIIVESILIIASMILLIIYRPGLSVCEAGGLLLMYSAFALGGSILFYEIGRWSLWVSFLVLQDQSLQVL